MKIERLPKNDCKLYACDRTIEGFEGYKIKRETKVSNWNELKEAGVSDQKCAKLTGISRASYFRYKRDLKVLKKGRMPPSKRPRHVNTKRWGEASMQIVLAIRRANPTYGKEKISIIIKRDQNRTISISTVGRILQHLSAKRLIQKSLSAPRPTRKRNFRGGHAKSWTYKDYKKIILGERIQVDHMTVTKNGVVCKHFQAWDRRSKFIHAQVYSNAKAASAKRFLLELVGKLPFDIISIQVDGGSEFMAEFEDACKDLDIPLIVLPPARPKYNGGVERGNRIFKEEFYFRSDLLANTIKDMRIELAKSLDKYNSYRPHKNLDGLTPMAYIQHTHAGA